MNKFDRFIYDVTREGTAKGLYEIGWYTDRLQCKIKSDADLNLIGGFLYDCGFESIRLRRMQVPSDEIYLMALLPMSLVFSSASVQTQPQELSYNKDKSL